MKIYFLIFDTTKVIGLRIATKAAKPQRTIGAISCNNLDLLANNLADRCDFFFNINRSL